MDTIHKDLSAAITQGLLEKVKQLINRYGAYNSGAYGYYVLLRKSIKLKHAEITKLLLTSGSKEDPMTKKTIPSNTPLHFAVPDNDLEIIEMILDHGANIHAPNECGVSPLLSAICRGQSKIVDLLISKGTNPANLNNGNSALHVSTEQALNNICEKLSSVHSKAGERLTSTSIQYSFTDNGKEHIVELTSGNNEDVTKNMITILYLAIRNCHSTPYLFYNDYKIEQLEKAETELHCAVCEGLSMIFEDILNQCSENTKKLVRESKPTNFIIAVENLLKNDIDFESSYDINRKFLRLETIKMNLIKMIQHRTRNKGLDLACEKEQIILHFVTEQFEIVNLLFVLKPIEISKTGQTESVEISYSSENLDRNIAKVLVLLNEDVEVWPLIYSHPYHIICTNNVVEVFYEYNTEIKCDFQSSTPLHIASHQGNRVTVEILLENGVNVNSKLGNGDTALHISTERYNKDIATILLEYGADVYSKNENGDTPLHVASKGTDPEIVSILLKYGSPVDSINGCGKTPLDIAIDLARPEFVQIFLKFGSDISNCYIRYPKRPSTMVRRGCIVYYEEKNLTEEEKVKEEKQKEIFRFLLLHLIMLKTANLFIAHQHQKHIKSREYNDFSIPHKKKCENEIKALKLEIISNNNLSLYDIITKSIQSLARHARNENIKRFFESGNYKTEFPIYAPLLERNYKMGLLYERAQEFFYCNFNLPYDCSDHIFQYLKIADIKRFMFGIHLYEPKTNTSLNV